MKINITIYSRLQHHQNEIALAATWVPPFGFGFSIGEWSWFFGIGQEYPELNWYGVFFSYSMPVDRNGDRHGGYFSAGLSGNIWWSQP